MLKESDVLHKGKYKGYTVADILTRNPDYLIWCDQNNVFDFDVEVLNMLWEYSNSGTYGTDGINDLKHG